MASDDEQRLIVNGRNEGGLALSPLRKQKSEVDNDMRARWRKQSEMFMEWVQSGENLDIYQVASVLYQTKGLKHPETIKSIIKMCVCAVLQNVGMLYLLFYCVFMMDDDEEEAGLTGFAKYCRMEQGGAANDDPFLKMGAIFFAAWISLVLADQMVAVSQYGLYSFGTQQPPFVNNAIIYFGLWVNFFASVTCWLASIWLMYVSDNVIDLVLNAVAVYFVKTIDDEMVFAHHYMHLEEVLEKEETTEEKEKGQQAGKAVADDGADDHQYLKYVSQYIYQLDETEDDERASCFYADCCHGQCINDPSKCWYVLSPLIIIAPLYLAVCY